MKAINELKLGALPLILNKQLLDSEEVQRERSRFPKQAVIGLGQGGGRIAAELSRFGMDTFLVNSSKSDMEEHRDLIPADRRIVTKSEKHPNLEGTDKNAQLGFNIAVENKDIYMDLARKPEITEAEFVWLSVSLGGGTGNGALKVALSYLSQVRKKVASLPDGKVTLGVICSLPSSDEKGTSFRRNALAGVSVLQNLINEKKIGNVLVIDNEKIRNYYDEKALETKNKTQIDAKSYSNMVVTSSIVEVSTIPLLNGRSVLDKTELLSTYSTPGWSSISKVNGLKEENKLEGVIESLFKDNEVLANYDYKEDTRALAGAVAVLYPSRNNIDPRIADSIYTISANFLQSKVNHAIANVNKLESITVYGLSVLSTPPTRIQQLREELKQWEQIEKEIEEKQKADAVSLGLDEFNDFFTVDNEETSNSMDEFSFEDEFGSDKPAKKVNLADLKDDF